MRPWVGLRNLVSRLKQVVLPAPFGPIRACTVPRATLRLTPLPPTNPTKSVVRSSVSRMVSALINSSLERSLARMLFVVPVRRRALHRDRNRYHRPATVTRRSEPSSTKGLDGQDAPL